jgi:hypothetical protein
LNKPKPARDRGTKRFSSNAARCKRVSLRLPLEESQARAARGPFEARSRSFLCRGSDRPVDRGAIETAAETG